MKNILLGFMTLLMLTPVLACGMAFCPTMANAAEEQPCHETNGNDGVMLNVDCMGVDLFQQDASHDIQLDQSAGNVDFTWVDLVAGNSFRPDNINSIRGPPDRTIDPQSQPSLILTTQRFRI